MSLCFRYGVVTSAKSMHLLAAAHSYDAQKKKVLTIKPEKDTRDGREVISSKCGLSRVADMVVGDVSDGTFEFKDVDFEGYQCVLVDEAQFLHPSFIDTINNISIKYNIPIVCYGLRTDFRKELFPASKRLFDLAADIEEIETVCWYCTRKASFNLKLVDGKATVDGPSVVLGGTEMYHGVCGHCYNSKLSSIVQYK